MLSGAMCVEWNAVFISRSDAAGDENDGKASGGLKSMED